MQITKGRIERGKKVVIYGPEGIGKSTLASWFPGPVFIDTEGSTAHMDTISRFDEPHSWQMILDEIKYVNVHPECCKTLVIDTADWAEKRCMESICSAKHVESIEAFGYGKGYTYVKEEFGKLLNELTQLINKGINVVLVAHAMMRKFEQPDELGAYDRWELKLSKQTAPLIKEWCDMLLFCNYKTVVVNVDNQGAIKGKNKAHGSERVMYTQHNACWDAKNRFGLPEEVAMSYASIYSVIEGDGKGHALIDLQPEGKPLSIQRAEAYPDTDQHQMDVSEVMQQETYVDDKSHVDPVPAKVEKEPAPKAVKKKESAGIKLHSDPEKIPAALRQLMEENNVDEWNLQAAVASRGYYPVDVLIENYDPDFIDGCLVAAWPQLYKVIEEIRENESAPFDETDRKG